MTNDLISREALKITIEHFQTINPKLSIYDVLKLINNAPTVNINDILYSIRKAKLGSTYGMTATKNIISTIVQDYEKGCISMLKDKEKKTDIGITIDNNGNYLLDLYKFKYNKEYNRLEITSRQFDVTFGVNTDSLINFLNKNSDVIFGDF